MKRDKVINVLLIIAGIVLAIALFGAGVFWKSNTAPTKTGFVVAPGGKVGILVPSRVVKVNRMRQLKKALAVRERLLPNAGLVDPKLISRLRENA